MGTSNTLTAEEVRELGRRLIEGHHEVSKLVKFIHTRLAITDETNALYSEYVDLRSELGDALVWYTQGFPNLV